MKNCPGIAVHLRLTVPKQMVLLIEQYTESRKELMQNCCNSAWTKSGGLIPWTVTVTCETCKTSCRTGKKPCERRFGEPRGGPTILCELMIWYHPIFCQRPVKTPPGKESSARCVVCGGASGKETSWSQTLRSWTLWTRHISMLGDSNAKEIITPKNGEFFMFPIADGTV